MAKRSASEGRLSRYWSGSPSFTLGSEVKVVVLSAPLKVALPPLFFCSLPKHAIGFSYPPGRQGMVVGLSLLAATVAVSMLLSTAIGPLASLAMLWLAGGTSVLILYNATRRGIAFVKETCSTCRLRPIIEEHETMHLNGESSESAIWREARKKYSYEGLRLGTDPTICSFCPIAKRLKDM